MVTDLKTNKQDTLVSLTQLNRQFANDKLNAVPQIKFSGNSNGYFSKDGKMFWIEKSGNDWKVKNQTPVDKDASNIKMFGDGQTFAFTAKNNLFVSKNGKTIAVTNEANENIISGQAVHRNEFGIDTGIFPAPNSESVAFYKMDQSMVADYPIIDWSVTPAVNHNIKYPMAGQTSHQVTLGVFNIKTQSTTFLKVEGEKDQYLTAVTWSPDSKYIFVAVLNRGQNHMKMNQYDAATGELIKTLFEETDSKYVEPQHPLTFFPNSNTDFIWQSQRLSLIHI